MLRRLLPTPTVAMLLLVAVAAYLLVSFGPSTLRQYDELARRRPLLGALYLGSVAAGSLLAAGAAAWVGWRVWGNTAARRRNRARRSRNPSDLTVGERRAELAENLAEGRSFAAGLLNKPMLRAEVERIADLLEAKRTARRLEIVAFGTISSGKSSLLNTLAGREVFRSGVVGGTTTQRGSVPWPAELSGLGGAAASGDEVVLVDTPGLAEVAGEGRAAEAATHAQNADLVLMVVDGPLKEYESELLSRLAGMEKRVVLCLNKADWYSGESRRELLTQLREQAAGRVRPEDVVAVRSRPIVRERVRVDPAGHETLGRITDPPDIAALADRLVAIVRREGGDLLLANLLMQSRGLLDDAKQKATQALDDEAVRVIDRYMWAAGGAGAIPLPVVDLAGGAAVTVKMVLDLAAVYKQKIDADTIVEMLSGLGKNLIAMLGASGAATAVMAAVGSTIKLAPGVGTLAGGLLQGIAQALVTRWIGRVFCRFYKNQMQPPEGGLAELAKREWQTLTTAEELRNLVRAGRDRLRSREPPRRE